MISTVSNIAETISLPFLLDILNKLR